MKITRTNAIGVLLPLSGSYESVGRKILHALLMNSGVFASGAKTAAATAAGPTGVGTAPLELVVRDTAGDADQAVRAMEQLVVEDQVIAVVGPVLKRDSADAATKADYYGIP